jgi:polar amino acid transport system substrate-binding protein
MTRNSRCLPDHDRPVVARRTCLLGPLLWPWWAGCTRAAPDTLQRLRHQGSIAVGYALEMPFVDLGPDGEPRGESPAAARHVAQALGLARMQWVQAEFAQLIDQLIDHRFDLVAAGLFISPERRQRVHFSQPTLQVRPGWLTAPGNPAGLGRYEDARRRDSLRLVVLRGSEEQRLLSDGARARLIEAPDVQSAQAAVRQGAADGLALSLPSVRHLALQDPARLQATEATGSEPRQVALAMRQGDAALHQAVDQALAGYLGSAGHLAELQRLGLSAADLPQRLPAP